MRNVSEESNDEAYFGHQESSGQLLNHITISQDQTAASNFQKDQLVVLQPSQKAEVLTVQHRKVPRIVRRSGYRTSQSGGVFGFTWGEEPEREERRPLKMAQDPQRFGFGGNQEIRALHTMTKQQNIPMRERPSYAQSLEIRESVPASLGTSVAHRSPLQQAVLPVLLEGSKAQKDLEHEAKQSLVHDQSSVEVEGFPLATTTAYLDCDNSTLGVSNRDDQTAIPSLDNYPLSAGGEYSTTALLRRIQQLEKENSGLKGLANSSGCNKPPATEVLLQWRTLYRISNHGTFLGEPSWVCEDGDKLSLKGDLPLSNPELYLQRHSEIAFVVYKDYLLHSQSRLKLKAKLEEDDVMRPPEPISESLKLVSSEMIEAVGTFFSSLPDFSKSFLVSNWKDELQAPYLFWYRFRDYYPKYTAELEPYQRDYVELLARWIEDHYGQEHKAADSRIREGYVSRKLMKYYIMPGDILVSKKKGYLQTFMAETWIVDLNSGKSTDKGEDYDQKAFHVLSNRNQANKPWSYSLSAWNYRYDGFFFKKHLSLKIELKVKQSDDEVRVQDMEIFPLKFATLQLRQQVERRGRTFWSCRQK